MKPIVLSLFGHEYNVRLRQMRYHDGNTAVLAEDTNSGDAILTASVNLDESRLLPKGTWFGKHWSENEGALEQLEAQGAIVKQPILPVSSGFIPAIFAYRLTE